MKAKLVNDKIAGLKFQIAVLAMIICAINACKPEDAPQNLCANSHRVSASFLIQEDWNISDPYVNKWQYYDTDTLCTEEVKLTANEEGASYRWHISGDTDVFTQKSFTINFNDYLATHPGYRRFDVQLIVNKTPDARCFPDDDGIDTVIRTFTIVDSLRVRTLIKGHFFGYWDGNPSDTTTIYITQGNTDPQGRWAQMYAYNLSPKIFTTTHGYGDYTYEKTAIGYREAICGVNAGQFLYNTIMLSKDNSVIIKGYDFQNIKNVKTFTGKKISD